MTQRRNCKPEKKIQIVKNHLVDQKPLRKAYKQNPEAEKNGLMKRLPTIHKRAKKEDAEIH